MDLFEKESKENKYKYDILYKVKIRHPLGVNNNKDSIKDKIKILLLGDSKFGKTLLLYNLLGKIPLNENKFLQNYINFIFEAEVNENQINV